MKVVEAGEKMSLGASRISYALLAIQPWYVKVCCGPIVLELTFTYSKTSNYFALLYLLTLEKHNDTELQNQNFICFLF